MKIKKNEIWDLEKYYFSSFVSADCSSIIPRSHIDFIRTRIFNHYGLKQNTKNSKRTFISRKNASKRRIINENEIYEILKNHQFDIVCAEQLTFKEQVMLWNDTKVMISMPGAAWANAIFGYKINCLFLHNPFPLTTHFVTLCNSLKHYHSYMLLEGQQENQDCYIDAEKIPKSFIKNFKCK